MKETYYFSHDYNARNDPKILAMRSEYGAEGYGWYWMIIEILREQPEYKLEYNKYLCITLAMQLQCDKNALHGYVEKCINEYKLFTTDGTYIWSNSLLRRMVKKDAKSEKAKKAANARWHKDSNTSKTDENDAKKHASDAQAMHEQCTSNAIKEKKGKENKIKDNNTTIEDQPVDNVDNSISDKSLELCKYFETLKPGENITSHLAALKIFINDYGYDWCKEALQLTVINKNAFIKGYMAKILKNWTENGKSEIKKNGYSKKDSTFNNFKGRQYSSNQIKDLEKKLLGDGG